MWCWTIGLEQLTSSCTASIRIVNIKKCWMTVCLLSSWSIKWEIHYCYSSSLLWSENCFARVFLYDLKVLIIGYPSINTGEASIFCITLRFISYCSCWVWIGIDIRYTKSWFCESCSAWLISQLTTKITSSSLYYCWRNPCKESCYITTKSWICFVISHCW